MTTAAMNELNTLDWPARIKDIAAGYEAMDDASIVDALRERFNLTVENIMHLAALVRICEHRRIDMSSVVALHSWMPKLKLVAQGSLMPEILQRYIGRGTLMNKLVTLPMDDQRKVAGDDPMRVVHLTEDGIDARMIPPSRMTPEQVQQVFAPDHVRDDSEQRTWLERKLARMPRPIAGPWIVNKKKGVIRITKSPLELSKKQLLDMIGAL